MKQCFIKNMPITINLKGIRENIKQSERKTTCFKTYRSTRLCFIRPKRTNAFIGESTK